MIFKPKPPPAMMMSRAPKPASVQISTFLGECLHYKNVYVIPNVLAAGAKPSEYLPQSPKLGLLMGRANPQKGFDLFLEALGRKRIPGWSFQIVGPGVDKDPLLRQLMKKYQLQDTVSLLPATNNPFEYIKRASCVIMPSRYEGLGMVALEALAIGRPVIASDVDGLNEIVLDGVNGRCFPCEDVQKLSDCLVSACGDENKLAEYARNAPSFLDKFRAESVVKAWKNVVMDCTCVDIDAAAKRSSVVTAE